jgi:outer membrane protein
MAQRGVSVGLVAGVLLGLFSFVYLSPPAQAQEDVPPGTLAAIQAAARQADANALSAAVIDGISSHPTAVEAIVRAAALAAPAYSLGVSLDASAAFPGFATRIADAAASVTPEIADTAKAIAEAPAALPETSALPPSPSEAVIKSRRGDDLLSDFKVSLGLGPALRPSYEGDEDYEVRALPVVDISWRDRLFFFWRDSFGEHYRRGFGAKLFSSRTFAAGPFLTYDPGREESASPHLAGAGNVDSAFEAGLFAEWYSERFRFSIDYKQSISGEEGHDGSLLTFAGGVGGRVNDQFSVGVSAWATYASENYMIAYYGVNAQQSAATSLERPIFNPGTGFKDIAGDITFRFDWDENWHGLFIGQWQRLIGDAAASPLIVPDSENQMFLGSVIGYRF